MRLKNHQFAAFALAAGMSACWPTRATTNWLTLVGNPRDAAVSTIEVYALPVVVSDNLRSLDIRVNRDQQSLSSEGIPFRSYSATILVDCYENKARFTTAAFYMTPLWEGTPHKIASWSAAQVRPVLFRNFDPNPRDKIIRAACRILSR